MFAATLSRFDSLLHDVTVTGEVLSVPDWQSLTEEQTARWRAVLDTLARCVPTAATVLIAGAEPYARVFADRLGAALYGTELPGIVVGTRKQPVAREHDLVIWLRTPRTQITVPSSRERTADIVVDLQDPGWPVIRHVASRLSGDSRWYVAEGRAFFANRAATWDTKYGADLPAYARAVAESGLPAGGIVIDVGCGTGRAIPALRAAVGPAGTVLGVDFTPQMLALARAHARVSRAILLLGDARHLPLRTASVDGVFAAALISHLPDTPTGLHELARVTRPGGRLVLFHPSGRVVVAARHGRVLHPDEPLAEAPLRGEAESAGWRLDVYDDRPERFYATATRR